MQMKKKTEIWNDGGSHGSVLSWLTPRSSFELGGITMTWTMLGKSPTTIYLQDARQLVSFKVEAMDQCRVLVIGMKGNFWETGECDPCGPALKSTWIRLVGERFLRCAGDLECWWKPWISTGSTPTKYVRLG